MSIRTRRPPSWWVAVMGMLAVLWIAVTVFYKTGASGVRFGEAGGGISFDRQFDFALFAIDKDAALVVSQDGSMAVARYGRGMFPFCPLCGTHELRGSIVNLAGYYKDGWIYTDHPGGPFAELYHVATGQETGQAIDVARPPGGGQVDASSLPEYAQRGLTTDPAHRITPAVIQQLFPELSPINESCVVFNAAFLLLAAAWLMVGLLIAIRGRALRDTRS